MGTLSYNSPELIDSVSSIDWFKVDVWSLGIIFFELLNGKTPWKSFNNHYLQLEIKKGIITFLNTSVDPSVQN